MREGLAMQRVKSDHVAQLLDLGCSAVDSTAWFVIELLEGETLDDVIVQRGPLTVKEACRVGLDVLGALSDVHEAGLIHRDIKPSNIIRVKAEGGGFKYKMIDLGSATAHAVPLFQLPQDVFAQADRTGEGRLTVDDVWECLKKLHLKAPTESAGALMGRYDLDGDGLVDQQEFAGLIGELSALPYAAFTITDKQVRRVFPSFMLLFSFG